MFTISMRLLAGAMTLGGGVGAGGVRPRTPVPAAGLWRFRRRRRWWFRALFRRWRWRRPPAAPAGRRDH